jgi:hypothetical protein
VQVFKGLGVQVLEYLSVQDCGYFWQVSLKKMIGNISELESIAHKWFQAFNDHDLEKLLSLYDENAMHYSPKLKIRRPETNGLITGKNALRIWWKDAFERLLTLNYELVRLTPFENRVFMEYIRHVKGEDDLYVGEMLEIKNGLIISSSVFHR